MNMPGLKNRCRGRNQMLKALRRGEAGTRCRRRYSGDRYHSGGFLLRAMPPSCILPPPASATASCRRNRSPLRQRRIESDADLVAATATAGGLFFFAAMQKRIGRRTSLPLRHCRPAIPHCSSDDAASIRKSEPEIKNRCTLEGINRQNPALIRKSGHEIKNQCTKEGVNRQNLASIPKFGPEIKNQCSRGVVAVCRRNHSPLPLRKLESDAALVAATTTAGGPFFSAAKKIRIRRGDSLQKAAHPQHISQHAFHHALPTRLALDVLQGDGHEAGSTVAAKADADAPGGGISLCFCRRGCAAPA